MLFHLDKQLKRRRNMKNQLTLFLKRLFSSRKQEVVDIKKNTKTFSVCLMQKKLTKCYCCGGAGLMEDSWNNRNNEYMLPTRYSGLGDGGSLDVHLSKCPVCKGCGYIEKGDEV
jgi:hypothetical protein